MPALSAEASKWNLNTAPVLPVTAISVLTSAYLLDTAGNFLTDPQGNRLIGYYYTVYNAVALNALAPVNLLNAR